MRDARARGARRGVGPARPRACAHSCRRDTCAVCVGKMRVLLTANHPAPNRNRHSTRREKLAIDKDKLLRLAAKEGDDGRCAALVQKGANVNKVGGSHKHTALHYAARFGHLRTLHTLLQLKADPNIKNGDGACVCACVFGCVCFRVWHNV